ncbi:alpha-amylase family protein [Actinomyces israelii]|uniref:Alpha-amylase family protein n=1 Tax=Actinomyces israelii TaxID=1659 RepID=A0ABT4I9R7_9ACTO|nr:alpha-amylase family protein [Actinomyces israelii]MCZ0857823.1 alpha-amylase family protein [Actinomyces israelii]
MTSESTGISGRGLPARVEHSIWWHVYPLGATGAPIRPETPADRSPAPRLGRLVEWLDYLVDPGANGLALGPVFESSTHGYDTTDHFRIDPRLGDDAVFDRLAEACRDRGVALMLDGVLNHVGTAHPLFRTARAGGPEQRERRLFRFDDADGSSGPPGVPGSRPGYAVFEGHEGLAVLNHDSDEVAELAVSVLSHWLGRGASAWRLDAAYAVPPAFWARVLPRVRSEFPDAWFVGEVIHGDYAGIVERSSMDSLTQYELWKAIWSSLLDENFFELDWCLNRHNGFLDVFTPLTFVGNHDVTRIASRIGDAKAALAVTVLLTVGGVPAIYYGDEQAFRGVKTDRPSGDDEVRPALPPGPEALSPLGGWLYRWHQELIGLRRRHPWLVGARTERIALENRLMEYDAVGTGGRRIRVRLRLEPVPRAEVEAPDEPALVMEHGG